MTNERELEAAEDLIQLWRFHYVLSYTKQMFPKKELKDTSYLLTQNTMEVPCQGDS